MMIRSEQSRNSESDTNSLSALMFVSLSVYYFCKFYVNACMRVCRRGGNVFVNKMAIHRVFLFMTL